MESPKVHDRKFDRNTSENELNNDLLKIRSWVYQWKMSDSRSHFGVNGK